MYSIILIFFLIFNFPVPFIQTSSILAFFISLPLIIKKNNITINFPFIFLLFIYLVILSITYFYAAIISQEYSLTIAILKVGIYILSTYAVTQAINHDADIIKLIIYAFILQCIISLFSYISPHFYNLTIPFRSTTSINIHYYSEGIRGNILSSDPFFSTGFLCAIAFYLSIYRWGKYSLLFNLSGVLSIISIALFSARTAIIGIIIACLFSLRKMKHFIYLIIFSIFILFIAIIFRDNSLLGFVFEPLYNFLYSDSLSSKSSDVLLHMLQGFDSSNIIGYGIWTNEDNSYYRNTDSGYMRNFYYYGITSIIFYTSFILLLLRVRNNTDTYFVIFLFTWYFLAHIKGEVIIYPAYANSLFLLVYIWNKKIERY